ncbi:CUB domain-containing protein 1-like [Poecilia reticulata]|uniref:CUB domain-containing protein 1-like n=1 Tax=Poecilia reticulata TaxID=8081 RepID=UPI0004A293F2|nr:PREDICTED: CUB domain-containing protein 1-like [Poecilia reticulata]XP_008430508.1 PREDICTED: CUB domain-containing protein 1-like [Poecilia reticulata]
MYFNKSRRISLRILLFLIVLSIVDAKNVKISDIIVDEGTTVNIINVKNSGCKVCQKCLSWSWNFELVLQPNSKNDVQFGCERPQDYFRVEIVRNIACTSTSCDNIVQSDVGLSNLLAFNRRFKWKIEADSQKSFQINFANTGLTQIAPSDSCADKHTYTLHAAKVLLGKYCSNGTISNATIQSQGNFSLDLPAGQTLSSGQFDVSLVERITTLANISVTLEEGSLSSTLLTPNYPDSFPNADLMEWYFQVPNNYKTAINFHNLKQPTCLKDNVEVTYRNNGTISQVVGIDKVQPEQNQRRFSLRLRNCQMDTGPSNQFSINLTVTSSPSSPVGNMITFEPTKRSEEIDSHLQTTLGVLAALVVSAAVVLLVVYIVMRKKKKEPRMEVSVYNSGDTNIQTGLSNFPEDCEDGIYSQIDETLVYSHFLQKDAAYHMYEPCELMPESKRKPASDKSGNDSNVSLFQSQQGHTFPNNYMEFSVDNNVNDLEQKKQQGSSSGSATTKAEGRRLNR